MAKLPKMNSIANLKNMAEKLQKMRMSTLGRSSSTKSNSVPEDVKEGHFAVIAVAGDEPKRFVVPLSCLTRPSFRRLLQQAADEYGFDHDGALTVPCRPSELERILAEPWHEAAANKESSSSCSRVNWGSCKTMVQSY